MQSILTQNNKSYVNRAAFFTATTLSVASIGFTCVALAASSTVTAVALGTLGIVALSASMGSITAWGWGATKNISEYGIKTMEHTSIALVGSIQYIAQNVVQAAVQGVCDGIRNKIRQKIN